MENPISTRRANFEDNKQKHEADAYFQSLIGDAGAEGFEAEDLKRLEEADAYDKHLAMLAERQEEDEQQNQYDLKGTDIANKTLDRVLDRYDSGELESTVDRAHVEAFEANEAYDAKQEKSAEELQSKLKNDPRLRRMMMMANDIARLRTSGATEQAIKDKEDKLNELLVDYSEVSDADMRAVDVIVDATDETLQPTSSKRELGSGAEDDSGEPSPGTADTPGDAPVYGPHVDEITAPTSDDAPVYGPHVSERLDQDDDEPQRKLLSERFSLSDWRKRRAEKRNRSNEELAGRKKAVAVLGAFAVLAAGATLFAINSGGEDGRDGSDRDPDRQEQAEGDNSGDNDGDGVEGGGEGSGDGNPEAGLEQYVDAFNIPDGGGGERLMNELGVSVSEWYGMEDELLNKFPNDFYRMNDGHVGIARPGSLPTEVQQFIADRTSLS